MPREELPVSTILAEDAMSRVVATVTTAEDLDWLRREPIELEADLLELRLDNLEAREDEVVALAETLPLPLILTARHPAEGGASELSESRRLGLLERFSFRNRWFDLELRTLRSSESARTCASRIRKEGGGVIGSWHDFEGLPPEAEMNRRLEEARRVPVDLFKVAVSVQTTEELCRLTRWAEDVEFPLSVMGMGPLGKLSRLMLGREVSRLNYGYLLEPNAPGQWRASELKRLLAEVRQENG